MRSFLGKRIKGLYKETVQLKSILEGLEEHIKESQTFFKGSGDVEDMVSKGIVFKKNILKMTEGERQFSRLISSLNELFIIQNTFFKEDVDSEIEEFIEKNRYKDIFMVNSGSLVYSDKESEKLIEDSFLDTDKIRQQVEKIKSGTV